MQEEEEMRIRLTCVEKRGSKIVRFVLSRRRRGLQNYPIASERREKNVISFFSPGEGEGGKKMTDLRIKRRKKVIRCFCPGEEEGDQKITDLLRKREENGHTRFFLSGYLQEGSEIADLS